MRLTAPAFALVAAALVVDGCARPQPAAGPPPQSELAISTPDSFLVSFETSRGTFQVMARSSWAPVGVDRFYELVRRRYYDDVYFFRVVPNFVAQFGLHGDSAVNAAWRVRRISDDSVRHSNLRGTVSFARSGVGTRTVQLFINLRDNARLDTANAFGFPPIGSVVSGMEVVDSLYSGYGGAAGGGGRGGVVDSARRSPQQGLINSRGNAYLREDFPLLDHIRTARITQEWRRGDPR